MKYGWHAGYLLDKIAHGSTLDKAEC